MLTSHITSKKQKHSKTNWQEAFQTFAQEAPQGPLRQFYEAGVVASKTSLKDTPLIALDLETTGLNPNKDEIISIGVIPIEKRLIRCAGSRYWMAKPEQGLHAESVTIHEITDSDLAKAPSLHSIMGEVLMSLAGNAVVVHYRGIERPFLKQASLKLYGYPLYFPVIDTMEIERQIIRQVPWWKRFGKQPSLRLDACRQRYHLPRYKAHHALTDALACAELLQAQASHHLNIEEDIASFWL